VLWYNTRSGEKMHRLMSPIDIFIARIKVTQQIYHKEWIFLNVMVLLNIDYRTTHSTEVYRNDEEE
jgi:hypothetical protein